MTRQETLERINRLLKDLDKETLQELLSGLEHQTTLTVLPSKGGKIGRHKPLQVKEGRQSEDIIREARDSRENAL
jgi:hypothetical protein